MTRSKHFDDRPYVQAYTVIKENRNRRTEISPMNLLLHNHKEKANYLLSIFTILFSTFYLPSESI